MIDRELARLPSRLALIAIATRVEIITTNAEAATKDSLQSWVWMK